MTDSATNPAARAASIPGLGLCLSLIFGSFAAWGPVAWGQTGPTSLLPGAASDAPAAPGAPGASGFVIVSPAAQGTPPAAPPPLGTAPGLTAGPMPTAPGNGIPGNGIPGNGIQVQELTAPDPSSVGLLDQGHGGFPRDLWAGSSAAAVRKAVAMLPAPQPWPSLYQLQRRLLLTSAPPPPGQPGDEPLVRLRAERLWAMGDLDDLSALLKVVPTPAATPGLKRLQAESALLAGDTAGACDQAMALRGSAGDDPFAAKLQVFCLFAGGKAREAGLGVDLLRDQKVNDPAFFAAADTLAGIGAGRVDVRGAPAPLVLAMARLAKLPLPDAAAPADPPVLRALAGLPGDGQLALAERAEAVGALSTDGLREIYQRAVFSQADLAAPLATLAAEKGARGRALMYRAQTTEQTPGGKAEVIAKALSIAAEHSGFAAAARLYAPDIAAITPTVDLGWFGYPAARALITAQRLDAARLWLSLARAQGLTDEGAASAVAALAPLFRLAARDEQPLAPLLAAWRKARSALPGDAGARREQVLLGLLGALGDKVPAEEWLALLEGPANVSATLPRPALRQLLRTAADANRVGETVAFALACLGDLDKTEPVLLAQVVGALRQLGLETEARLVAVEAAIANGV